MTNIQASGLAVEAAAGGPAPVACGSQVVEAATLSNPAGRAGSVLVEVATWGAIPSVTAVAVEAATRQPVAVRQGAVAVEAATRQPVAVRAVTASIEAATTGHPASLGHATFVEVAAIGQAPRRIITALVEVASTRANPARHLIGRYVEIAAKSRRWRYLSQFVEVVADGATVPTDFPAPPAPGLPSTWEMP